MHHRVVDVVAPALYAVADLVVIVGPALVLVISGDLGGMGDAGDRMDLLWTSLAIGIVHSGVAFQRLRHQELVARYRLDLWLSSINALVVLALAGPLLLTAVLYTFVDEHASLADRSLPVALLWAGIHLLAIVLAELTGRITFWWLEPRRTGVLRRRLRESVTTPDEGARVG